MGKIVELDADEILDSRGRPTVRVYCRVDDGPLVTASGPLGGSKGFAGGFEIRDGYKRRYAGLGCRKAVENVRSVIRRAVAKRTFASIAALDGELISLDGSPNKRRLGANAILGTSLAFARASAAAEGIPFFQKLSELVPDVRPALPRL